MYIQTLFVYNYLRKTYFFQMEEEVDPEEAEYKRKMKEFEEEREKYKQEHPELQQTIQQEDVSN